MTTTRCLTSRDKPGHDEEWSREGEVIGPKGEAIAE